MISHPRTHKGAVLIAAYVMFACVAALLSVNLTSPTSTALGADWQCSRFALVFTTCTPVRARLARTITSAGAPCNFGRLILRPRANSSGLAKLASCVYRKPCLI